TITGLEGGSNLITILGVNRSGEIATDVVWIVRGGEGTGLPFVDITNENFVALSAQATIAGTNNIHVEGGMWWTNITGSAGGECTRVGDAWTALVTNLQDAVNTIYVYGTNLWNQKTNDVILISYGGVSPYHYAATNGPHIYPYNSWERAATNVQDAINAAVVGDAVFVSNGVYRFGGNTAGGHNNRVMIDKAIDVSSINGPSATVILGEGP
ncbi:MAG: hypothetical protein GY869_19055, partial [Planctomycetes bacterium]|nr:hypothetical protein [Planctomycetota bacterium]